MSETNKYITPLIMTEVWKTVESHPNYEVSNIGNVRNTKTGKKLNPSISNCGYALVSLSNNGKVTSANVHSLVAKAFIPNEQPDFYTDVHHIDGDRLNNKVENLQWTTHAQNMSYGKSEFSVVREYLIGSLQLLLHKANENKLDLHKVATQIIAQSEATVNLYSAVKQIEYR